MSRLIEVVGSLNIDFVTQTPRVPGPGETLRASSFTTGLGGKGSNQVVACARLWSPERSATSKNVAMIGAVGDDQFGSDFKAQLKNEGIQERGVVVKAGQKTGSTVILVEEETGENRILFTPGANDHLEFEDVQLDSQPGGLVLLQLEVPLDIVSKVLTDARKLDKETILNPAPATKLPDELYKNITYLIMNETEAATLSGIDIKVLLSSLDSAAEHFLTKGVQTVIITLGAQGAYWRTTSKVQKALAGERVASRKAKVVDTTGAGDTFVGAFAAFLADRNSPNSEADIRDAVSFANIAASISVEKAGAQSSIPSLKDLPST